MTKLEHVRDQHNHDLYMDLLIKGGLGAVWSVVTFSAVFFGIWLLCGLGFGSFDFLIAGGVTLLYALVASWTAWRKVHAVSEMPTLAGAQRAQGDMDTWIGLASSLYLPDMRREAITAKSLVLVAGPQSLLEAWRSLKRLVPTSRELLDRAWQLLQTCPRRIGESCDPTTGLFLLHLGLARLELEEDGVPHLLTTAKGRSTLDRAGDGRQPAAGGERAGSQSVDRAESPRRCGPRRTEKSQREALSQRRSPVAAGL